MKNLCNISIDDVSPHPLSSLSVLDRCYELIDKFDKIKFTLFVPVAYWRTMKPSVSTKRPLLLSEHPNFCEELRKLPKQNFEVAYHGYYHGIPGISDNDEFRHLNYDDAVQLYLQMFEEVGRCGLSEVFKMALRPPAWRMSPASIKAAKDVGLEVLALSPDLYADGSLDYGGQDREFGDVIYYNVCPPFKALNLFRETEIVYHACEWDKNYLDIAKTRELANFLSANEQELEVCFLKEIVEARV